MCRILELYNVIDEIDEVLQAEVVMLYELDELDIAIDEDERIILDDINDLLIELVTQNAIDEQLEVDEIIIIDDDDELDTMK